MTKNKVFRNITLNDIHLVNCIISSIKKNYKENQSIKILDVGCGSGTFLLYMIDELKRKFPKIELDFYAFDIDESELTFKDINSCNHLSVLIKTLKSKYTDIDWDEKIKLINENNDWHQSDNFFDVIVSNQVLEHVMNKELFFKKLNQFLKFNGNSFHLTPVLTNVWEFHVNIPFAHWIRSKENLRKYIIFYKLITSPLIFLNEYEMVMEDINDKVRYLSEKTDYATTNQFIKYCNKNKLTVNLKYTYPYYLMKVCQWIRVDMDKLDFYKCNTLIHYLTFFIHKRLSSITMHIFR